MYNVFFQLLKIFFVILSPVFISIAIFLVCLVYFYIYFVFFKKQKIKKRTVNYKKESVMKRLFVQFPRRLMLDIIERDPDEFKEFGFQLVCAEQGSGKTTTVVHMLHKFQNMYPKLKVRTNMNYLYQDGEITSGDDLVANSNGIFGQIEVIDEIQSWYSSLQSKNFPPELLEEICQQRKERKMILGTAQVFGRVAKPLREICCRVYVPTTVFGCLTIVRLTKPKYWNEEKQIFTRFTGTFFYVHTDEIRNSFDTYLKIQKMKKKGFRDIPLHELDKKDLKLGSE